MGYIFTTILIVFILDGIVLLPGAIENTDGSNYSKNVNIFKREDYYSQAGSWGNCHCVGPYNLNKQNIEAALSGFDLPLSNPFDTTSADPGWRSVIFRGIHRYGENGNVARPIYITVTENVWCSSVSEFTEITSWNQFITSQKNEETIGIDFSSNKPIGVEGSAPVGPVTVGLKTEIPPLLSFGNGKRDTMSSVESFFNKEKGAMLMLQQKCFKQAVSFIPSLIMAEGYYDGFKEALKVLSATPSDPLSRIRAFKKFTHEYGTHFSRSTQMGSSFSVYISITENERKTIKKEDITECSHHKAVKVVGVQTGRDTEKCKNSTLNKENMNSNYVSRTIISSKGGSPVYHKDTGKWEIRSDAVPVPVQMKLEPLYELFSDDLFKSIGIKKKADEVKGWYKTLVFNYCELYGFQCNGLEPELIGCENCKLNKPCKKISATHGTCSGSRKVCKFSAGISIIGNDIKRVPNVYSASDCCLKCRQHQGCGAFTFVHEPARPPICILKTHINRRYGRKFNRRATSGRVTDVFTPKTFQRYRGLKIGVYASPNYVTTGHYSVLLKETTDLDDCESKCFIMEECYHYNYNSSGNGDCALFPSLIQHDILPRQEGAYYAHFGTVTSHNTPSWNYKYQM